MATWTRNLLFCLAMLIATGSHAYGSYTVIVTLEAKPEKAQELRSALLEVARQSRAEKACLSYRVYQDGHTSSKFALFEEWESKELHHKQFTKPYILAFAKQLDFLLAAPFTVVAGEPIT